MAKNANDKAAKNEQVEAPKRERRTLTDAERIAKLEADLKAAREKAEAKNKKAGDQLREQRSKLVDQIIERRGKIDAINTELAKLGIEDRFDWSEVGIDTGKAQVADENAA